MVHTEIGNHCIGARVNGSGVSLDHELKSGDVVEIVTRKNAHPSQHWISFAKTNHARSRVRTWFHDLDEDRHLRDGKELLNQKLKQLGKPLLDDGLSALRSYDGKNLSMKAREDVLKEIGKGTLTAGAAIRKIFSFDELLMSRSAAPQKLAQTSGRAGGQSQGAKFVIGGDSAIPYHFVKCCSTKPGDDLVGYITRGRGIAIHKKSCLVVQNSEPGRLTQVNVAKGPYPIHVKISADDRVGLIRDLSQTIASSSINIVRFTQSLPDKGHAEIDFTLEIENFDQLERVLSNLEKIPSVRRAVKTN